MALSDLIQLSLQKATPKSLLPLERAAWTLANTRAPGTNSQSSQPPLPSLLVGPPSLPPVQSSHHHSQN